MGWPLWCMGGEPLVLMRNSAVGGARDRSKRAQHLCRWQAADSCQTRSRFGRADLRNRRRRALLDRSAWFSAPHHALTLWWRGNPGGLISKLCLRVLRDQLAFASLNRRSIGFRVQSLALIICFADARSGDCRLFGRGFIFSYPPLY